VGELLRISFQSEVIHWRGPSPFFFLRVPEKHAIAISNISKQISYGWGVIPCDVICGSIDFYTALIPKDGGYLVPLKKAVREAASIELGNRVKVEIRFNSGL
jgi:Domain of unknown function (DUF1905)